MINLQPLECNYIDVFNNIARAKHKHYKSKLVALSAIVEQRYNLYLANRAELSAVQNLTTLDEESKDVLKSCYGQGKILEQIKSQIINSQTIEAQIKCPYCGMNEPNTFDHYMPQGIFPEFAVMPLNLLPCCGQCNNKKLENWLENRHRTIINFYSDIIPAQKYLFAELSYNGIIPEVPTITFFTRKPPETDERLFEIIESHYCKLNLLNRYELQSNSELSVLHDEVLFCASDISMELQKSILIARVNVLKNRFGINHWRVALIEAVIECDEFFSKCY